MFMISAHTKFHISGLHDPLFIVIKP